MRTLGWRIELVIMKFKANNFPMNYTLFCLEKKKKKNLEIEEMEKSGN